MTCALKEGQLDGDRCNSWPWSRMMVYLQRLSDADIADEIDVVVVFSAVDALVVDEEKEGGEVQEQELEQEQPCEVQELPGGEQSGEGQEQSGEGQVADDTGYNHPRPDSLHQKEPFQAAHLAYRYFHKAFGAHPALRFV